MPPDLVDLPSEVLGLIFAQVTRKDVKSLASTCTYYRTCLLPFVMSRLCLTWAQILGLQDSVQTSDPSAQDSPQLYCEQLSIMDANAYNEYQHDTFGTLLSPDAYPRLHHVSVVTASSSHWLKYNKCTHISSLCLENAEASRTRKVFCLGHVSSFGNLAQLTLHKFHFNWQESDIAGLSSVRIRSLALHDCTWQYPFNLSQFNPEDSLRALSITYSHNNSFCLSERFFDFLSDPLPDHSASLRKLEIGFIEFTENKKILTSTLLATFLRVFHGLDHLVLYGWYTTDTYMKLILSQHKFPFPVDLDVELEMAGQAMDDHNSHIKGSLRWKRRLYHKI